MGTQPDTSRQNRRRLSWSRYIVPSDTFSWFTRSVALSTLATGALLGTAVWLYSQKLYAAMGLPPLSQDASVLAEYHRLTVVTATVVVLVGSLYITAVSAYLFHKVAGPAYRFERHMREVLDGRDVEPLRFRRNDQLLSLADVYNQLLYQLEVIEPKPETENPG